MADFPAYLRSAVMAGLKSLDASSRDETYAVSLFVYDDEDDPRRPTLTVGTNTESQVRLHDEGGDDLEVRWNYAYWLQNALAVIGHEVADPVGAQLCRAWIENQGLWFDDARSEHETFGDLTFEHMIKWYSTPRP
ncbi:MAG: DUF4303 domain-containing protein, partial [Actinomycetota bacterium]|nr:DUF4303 domain-containing protein [Actinomycetota bacterium]